jgi:ankyrin repeat protein
LLDHGADIDAADANGWTPLMHACSVGKIETVQLLLQRGARINVKSKFKETALDIFGKRLRKGSSDFSPADQEVFQILKSKTKKSWL